MQPALLRCYLVMLGRLQAEESLRSVAELQAALPGYKQEHRQSIIREWQRAMESRQEPPSKGKLAMMGIGLVKVDADGREHE